MAQPEAYISDAGTLFDEEGRFNNENTRNFLKDFLQLMKNGWKSIYIKGKSKSRMVLTCFSYRLPVNIWTINEILLLQTNS